MSYCSPIYRPIYTLELTYRRKSLTEIYWCWKLKKCDQNINLKLQLEHTGEQGHGFRRLHRSLLTSNNDPSTCYLIIADSRSTIYRENLTFALSRIYLNYTNNHEIIHTRDIAQIDFNIATFFQINIMLQKKKKKCVKVHLLRLQLPANGDSSTQRGVVTLTCRM